MVIDNSTSIMGIIGNPLKQSLSPLMHNLTLQKMNLNYVYVPLEIAPQQLAEAITALRVFNITGINVTIPFKEQVIPFLDDLSEEARFCKAVNVIKNDGGRLIGYNTDGRGFIASLEEEKVALHGRRALFMGAGGAARATACGLVSAGIAHIDFMDPDEDRALQMATFIESKNCHTTAFRYDEDKLADLASTADIIINASPVGMFPKVNACPISSLDRVPAHTVLCDLIYNPGVTKFLQMGKNRGLKTVGGVNMFVYQGAFTLEILTGIKPPVEFMKEVVLHQL